CDETVLPHFLLRGQFGEVFMQSLACLRGGAGVLAGHLVLYIPCEDVADPGLPRLEAPESLHDAAVHHAAHSRHFGELVSVHHVACGGAHDGDHLPGLNGTRGGCGHVRVDVTNGDRDPGRQARPRCGFFREAARCLAELGDRLVELIPNEPFEVGVERTEELRARVSPLLVDTFVTRGARIADVGAAQLPDDPVRCLEPTIDCAVKHRIL